MTVLCTAATLFGLACAEPQQILWIDSWWSGDYAQGGCERTIAWMKNEERNIKQFGCDNLTACPETMPLYIACKLDHDPHATAFRFEDLIMTQFALNPNCKGIILTRFYGTDSNKPRPTVDITGPTTWSLIIDYTVGKDSQAWTLQSRKNDFHQAESGSPAKIAADVCTIINRRGGTIAR